MEFLQGLQVFLENYILEIEIFVLAFFFITNREFLGYRLLIPRITHLIDISPTAYMHVHTCQ